MPGWKSLSWSYFYCLLWFEWQRARDLAKPSLTKLLHNDQQKLGGEEEEEGKKKIMKRKCDSHESSDNQGDLIQKENEQSPSKLKKARNVGFLFLFYHTL